MSSPTSESSHYSPALMTADLGLDPDDPLHLLLHNSSQTGSSSGDSFMDEATTPPDWSSLSNLWPSMDSNQKPGVQGFSNLNMVMDFNAAMAVDPNALHFGDKLGYPYEDTTTMNDLLMGNNFPFTFQPNPYFQINTGDADLKRRLSITSSSSSSGASLSPILERSPVQSAPQQTPAGSTGGSFDQDAADELAQRVIQATGMMRAVPINGNAERIHTSPQQQDTKVPSPTFPMSSDDFMLALPQSYAQSSFASSSSSAASTPPPTTPPPTTSEPLGSFVKSDQGPNSGVTMGMLGRPKTSHTTIERRYRTNLNARIQSLRMAVPALRVLEDREGSSGPGSRKVKVKVPVGKVVTAGKVKREDGVEVDEIVDFVDDRGFVDGVKVARKCSKANVLGKAVEYIRVLKRRELRLKREQDGLKALVSSLVGGQPLLREWEREWKDKFGGEEKDEVEGEDLDDGDGASDDEDGFDDEDDEGRKRKKAKIEKAKKEIKEKKPTPAPPPQMQIAVNGQVVPEKRKRGRPRKNPLPTPVNAAPTEVASASGMSSFPSTPVAEQRPQGMQAPQQYLLATFALFSFFNSPLTSSYTSSSTPHTHSGTVLTPTGATHPIYPEPTLSWGWRDGVQVFHLVVSFLVFASIIMPWLSMPKRPLTSTLRSFVSRWSQPSPPALRPRPTQLSIARLLSALHPRQRGAPNEVSELRAALATSDTLAGLVHTLRDKVTNIHTKDISFEQKSLEQRAWFRLSEIYIFGDETPTLWTRITTFLHIRAHISWFTCSGADLATLAMILYPAGRLVRSHAQRLWQAALDRKDGGCAKPYEQLVLESLSLDEAMLQLAAASKAETVKASPLGVLASRIVRQSLATHSAKEFVQTVLPSATLDESVTDAESENRVQTLDAARSLGGDLSELADVADQVWSGGDVNAEALSSRLLSSFASDSDEEIAALLSSVLLYRQIFPTAILDSGDKNGSGVSILLSPPPSPCAKDMRLHYTLRKALGSRVFEDESISATLEEARDHVVDMLLNLDRRRK